MAEEFNAHTRATIPPVVVYGTSQLYRPPRSLQFLTGDSFFTVAPVSLPPAVHG